MSTERGGPVQKVVIVGGGTAGWMTAAALARMAPRPIRVELVESEAIGTVGVGESTLPHIRAFNDRLGLDEAEFMRATKATFKLGIQFNDWNRMGDSYIHPFGDYGAPGGEAPFHHYWLRGRSLADVGPIDDYSLPIVAARQGRFAPPSNDARSLLSTYGYAYQFDAGLYARYLRKVSEKGGVKRTEGRIVEVIQDPQDGRIQAVKLESGETVEGDLFVDCSGFRALLIEQTLKSGFDDWSHWLPCDRAVAMPCETDQPTVPYTRATALEAGWKFRIPLQHRVGNGYVYSSAFLDDQAALDRLSGTLEGKPLASPNALRFTAGQRRKNWASNCVSVGLSSGFIEPLESTSIHLIQIAITKLIELWPTTGADPVTAAEFNRQMDLEYLRIRDFIILHYCSTERRDTPFWDYVRTMSLPDTLSEKIELFRARGVVQEYREGLFLHPSWVAVYLGQGVLPQHHHPFVDGLKPEQLTSSLARLRATVAQAAGQLPSQDDYIARYCAA